MVEGESESVHEWDDGPSIKVTTTSTGQSVVDDDHEELRVAETIAAAAIARVGADMSAVFVFGIVFVARHCY